MAWRLDGFVWDVRRELLDDGDTNPWAMKLHLIDCFVTERLCRPHGNGAAFRDRHPTISILAFHGCDYLGRVTCACIAVKRRIFFVRK